MDCFQEPSPDKAVITPLDVVLNDGAGQVKPKLIFENAVPIESLSMGGLKSMYRYPDYCFEMGGYERQRNTF